MPNLDFLHRTLIFEGLDEGRLARVAECCRQAEASAG